MVVKETGRAGFLNAVQEAFDQATGLILFRKTETESSHGFGDIEDLPVVIVVAAVKQKFVETLAGLVDQSLPDRIAFLGGAERE